MPKADADIDDVMRRKVIPLLAEYFYDDRNKLTVVLGDADDGEGDRGGGFLDRRLLKRLGRDWWRWRGSA